MVMTFQFDVLWENTTCEEHCCWKVLMLYVMCKELFLSTMQLQQEENMGLMFKLEWEIQQK